MRRRVGVVLVAVLVLTAWAVRRRGIPERGTLVLMRDEGGCLVMDTDGVKLEWSERGATLARVHQTWQTAERTVGEARPFPLERARAIARRFEDAATSEEPELRVFRSRTLGVELATAEETVGARLDCRGDYSDALELDASWLRLAAYRVHLWRPPCEGVDPLYDELAAAALHP